MGLYLKFDLHVFVYTIFHFIHLDKLILESHVFIDFRQVSLHCTMDSMSGVIVNGTKLSPFVLTWSFITPLGYHCYKLVDYWKKKHTNHTPPLPSGLCVMWAKKLEIDKHIHVLRLQVHWLETLLPIFFWHLP